jgi:hypothetical protein
MNFQLTIETKEDYNIYNDTILIPKLSNGFNSYYLDKLKHIKEAIEDIRKKEKESRYYKIVSPGSVSKNSELYKTFNLGLKQLNYIIFEIFKIFNIKGSVNTNDKKTEESIKNISNILKITQKTKDYDVYFNNKKINFDENFYKQEAEFIPILEEEIKNIEDLKKGGIFITRIYNIFLQKTENIVMNLINNFDKVILYKPITVDNYKVDKYLICIGKKAKPNKEYGIIKDLNKINEEFIIFQVEGINEVINYINGKNYRGSEYDKYVERQMNEQKKLIKDLK